LENLDKHYNWLLRTKVVLKKKKNDSKGKFCDVVLSCPGPQIFASSNEQTFEIAVAETIRDLEVQLRKRKSEMKPF